MAGADDEKNASEIDENGCGAGVQVTWGVAFEVEAAGCEANFLRLHSSDGSSQVEVAESDVDARADGVDVGGDNSDVDAGDDTDIGVAAVVVPELIQAWMVIEKECLLWVDWVCKLSVSACQRLKDILWQYRLSILTSTAMRARHEYQLTRVPQWYERLVG